MFPYQPELSLQMMTERRERLQREHQYLRLKRVGRIQRRPKHPWKWARSRRRTAGQQFRIAMRVE